MKRPCLPLPAVQAATTKILYEMTKYCSTTNIFPPKILPAIYTVRGFIIHMRILQSRGALSWEETRPLCWLLDYSYENIMKIKIKSLDNF